MAENQKQQGSRFVVDLGSVKLSTIVEKQVETDIRAVVLKALAKSDFAGRGRLPPSAFDWFPNRTLGLWLDPDKQIPWAAGPLGPSDHTLVVREVMTYPWQIIKQLRISTGDPRPSGSEVLEAALQVEEIDSYAKERIKKMLEMLPQLEKAQPKSAKRIAAKVENLITGLPIAEQIRRLRDPKSLEDIGDECSPGVLEVVAAILEDGATTIYSPDFPFHRMLRSGTSVSKKDSVDVVKDIDTIGAAIGGGAGTLIPGVGTVAGGAVIGGAASAGAAIAAVLDWVF